MPRVHTAVPHNLGKDQAIDRMKAHGDLLERQWSTHISDLVQEWNDNVMDVTFKAFGFPIRGKVRVEDAEVTVDVELPLAAIMLKGAIKQQISKELGTILA